MEDLFRYARMSVGGGAVSEETMTFGNRRDVSGLKVPFHVTTTVGGRVIDELIFD